MPRFGSYESEFAMLAQTVRTAEQVIAEGKTLTKHELGAALGCGPDWARARLARARRMGLTDLTMVTEKVARMLRRLPSNHGDRCTHRGSEESDPAIMAELVAVAYLGMGDGRDEDDDPRRIGGCHNPKPRAAEMAPAEACRRYLREWRVIRGRAKAEPRPREVGKACCWHTPRKPAKRRDSILFGKQVERHYAG